MPNLATADPDFEARVRAEVAREQTRLTAAGTPPTHRGTSLLERRIRRRLTDQARRKTHRELDQR